jgi:FO synthase
LRGGVNDLGGTLMNESISRAAGTAHGQELAPAELDALILRAGRLPQQRTTLYEDADAGQTERSYRAPELLPMVLTPLKRRRAAVAETSPAVAG